MAPRTTHRLRYALRLVASVFLLSSPCGGSALPEVVARVTTVAEPDATRATFAAPYRSVR